LYLHRKEYLDRLQKAENSGKTIVCCSTCHNPECQTKEIRIKWECLKRQYGRNSLLFWSKETGYLEKMHKKYSYIHWKSRPAFIKEIELKV